MPWNGDRRGLAQRRNRNAWVIGALLAMGAAALAMPPAGLAGEQERIDARSAALSDFTLVWSMESDIAGASYGTSNTPGDFNGDGFTDLAISAPYLSNGQTLEGRMYVYHGTASGLQTTASWLWEPNTRATIGEGAPNRPGDINGDGYDDLVFGGRAVDMYRGRVYVFHGSAAGVPASPSTMVQAPNTGIEMHHGLPVNLMDINGDGHSDVFAGSPYWRGNFDEGSVWVYHGSESGLNTSVAWQGRPFQSYNRASVAGPAGDVNGDGFEDFIWSAYWHSNGQSQEGKSWLHYGSASGLAASADWSCEGNQAGAQSMSHGGTDFNNDGYADVVICEQLWDNGQTDEGQLRVFHGSTAGLGATPDWAWETNTANAGLYGNFNPGDLNGDGYNDLVTSAYRYDGEGAVLVFFGSSQGLPAAPDYIIKNGQADAYFGLSVVLADATGDGLNDLIVGAGYYDNGQNDEGATFIYSYAAAPTPTATPAVTPTPAPVPAVGAAATLGLVLLFGLLLARRRFISL